MKNIIVVGYPKSGNTWITRLIAELVGCQVAGFWNSELDEVAVEGQDRVSDFRCFKSHHQLDELNVDIDNDENPVIYVLRDPRDVAVSGAGFFKHNRSERIEKFLEKIPKGKSLYGVISKIIHPEAHRIDKMIQAILYGSEEVHYWCRIFWKNHYMPYL